MSDVLAPARRMNIRLKKTVDPQTHSSNFQFAAAPLALIVHTHNHRSRDDQLYWGFTGPTDRRKPPRKAKIGCPSITTIQLRPESLLRR